jgi:hypothetical protein
VSETRSTAFLAMVAAVAMNAHAAAPGDPAAGRALVEKDCNGCHVRQFGSAERIYVRPDRRVKTRAQLEAQVTYCNTQLGTGLFPDEEASIVSWLDREHYRFAP